MHPFTLVFLVALGLGTLLHLWLAWRHAHHIRRHRDTVPVAFQDKVSLDEHQKAADYTLAKLRFSEIDRLAGVLLLIVWTLGGGLQFIDTAWQAQHWSSTLTGIGVVLTAFLAMGLLDLPFSLYSTFSLEQRFGFNRTTVRQFFTDLVTQTALMGLLGGGLLWVFLVIMDTSGQWWWLVAWLALTAFTLAMTWAYPTLIAPLFNKFTPLEDDNLKQRIQALLSRCGFISKGIFVMDGSRRSGHGNAYFTGLGNNKRIVFFDTLLKQLDGDEIEAVLAHELGHFRRKHVTKRLLVSLCLTFAGLALLGWLEQQVWFYTALGVQHPSHHMALLLFMLAAPVFTTFTQPLSAAFSRKHEFEADDYAAEQTNARNLIHALVKLYRENANTLTPDPLYSAFYDSHPPAPVRIMHLSTKLAQTAEIPA